MSPPTRMGPPRDLAALLRFVESGCLAAPRRSREMASAIRMVGAWTYWPLEQLPTDPAALRRHLKKVDLSQLGVSKVRFRNVLSLLKRALRLARVKNSNRPIAEAVSPGWRTVLALLEQEPYIRSSLAPFARFCSSWGIEPHDVSNDVGLQYLEELIHTSLNKTPETTHQTVCRAWEQARARIAGWPNIQLVVPCYQKVWTQPLSAFPSSFQAELEEYLRWRSQTRPSDLLDETALDRPLKPLSIKTVRYQLRQAASALVISGVPIEQIGSLAVLANPSNFKAALRVILDRERADPSNTRTAGMIAHAIRVMAKHYIRLSAAELEVLNTITNRLSQHRPGLTEKNRRFLAQFRDPDVQGQFLSFPPMAVDRLLRSGVRTRAQAVRMSLLVALDLLIWAPMRIGNLASLRYDEDIRFPRHADGEAVIQIASHKVKNEEPLEHILPADVTRRLEYFLRNVHPMLDEGSPWLFPGDTNRPKRSDTLSKQLTQLVRKELCIRFSPHQIRHFMAMIHLDARPGDIETPRRVLGHRSAATTANIYDGFSMVRASRVHGELIQQRRRYQAKLDTTSGGRTVRRSPRRR